MANNFEHIKITPREPRPEKPPETIAEEIWSEAKAQDTSYHREGLKLVWDIAINHPAAKDPRVRSELRKLYESRA